MAGVYILPNKGHNGWGKKSGILKRGKKNQGEKKRGRGKKGGKRGKKGGKREKRGKRGNRGK